MFKSLAQRHRRRYRNVVSSTIPMGLFNKVRKILVALALYTLVVTSIVLIGIPLRSKVDIGGSIKLIPTENRAVFKPIDPSLPRALLILSYQRCGSSFFCGLFDNHPQGFLAYEPLDGLYSAMYGTSQGWNGPGDIMSFSNGARRSIPLDEQMAVSKYLTDFLTCQMDGIPTESIVHYFWGVFQKYQKSLRKFTRCISKIPHRSECRKNIAKVCESRFGKNLKKNQECHNMLWNSEETLPNRNIIASDQFGTYSECMRNVTARVSPCVSTLRRLCSAAKLKTVKSVRATMASVEAIIDAVPNLRIVHLMRDPRGVVLSRKKFHLSAWSLYAKSDVIKEAKVYCQGVARDIRLRHQLERKYPGIFLEVLYDDFVQSPLNHTRQIYDLMNLEVPDNVLSWVQNNTRQDKDSRRIAAKWQGELTYISVMSINQECKPYIKTLPPSWFT